MIIHISYDLGLLVRKVIKKIDLIPKFFVNDLALFLNIRIAIF